MNNVDTREKLEADIEIYFSLWMSDCKRTKETIRSWLNRQAAITAHEISNDIAIMETNDAKLMNEGIRVFGMSLEEINVLRKYKTELENQLEIERKRNDSLQEQLWKTNEQLYDETELTNEFRKELAKRDKGIERLKRRRDELQEEIDNLKSEYEWLFRFHTGLAGKCGTKDCPSLVSYVGQLEDKISELEKARTLPSVERVRELEGEVERLRMKCEDWEHDWLLTEQFRIEAEEERDALKEERDELKAEQLSWPTMLQYKEACAERDAYRELCGRMRKMAQEMANMEVD